MDPLALSPKAARPRTKSQL